MADDEVTPSTDDPEVDQHDRDWQAEATKWKALARKHEKAAKENADAARRLAEIEASGKSEQERLAEARQAAEERATSAEREAARLRVALRKGLSDVQARRLVGDAEDELEADADELLAIFAPAQAESDTDLPSRPRERLRPGAKPRATYLEAAQLITLNAGEQGFGFHICYRCGYAGSERVRAATGGNDLPGPAQYHSPLWMSRRQTSCWKPGTLSPFARNRVLLHEETTDVLLLDFRGWGVRLAAEPGAWLAWTAGLPHAVGQVLDLDAGDVAALPYPLTDGMGILLYDTAAGGAGHVSELLLSSVTRDVFTRLRERLYVDDEHDARCAHGCLSCVLSYEAQRFAGDGLDRRRGLELLDALLSGEPVSATVSKPRSSDLPSSDATTADRIAAARERRRRNR